MHKYLIDVNLPKYFHYFKSDEFVHIVDINPEMTDEEIWNYAIEKELIILTKDTDFYNRFISSDNSPKIIFFKTGNMTLNQLHIFFKAYWNTIETLISTNRLIIVTKDTIQRIF